MKDDEDRKEYLLKQVLKLFKAQEDSPFVLNIFETQIVYDGALCDGTCLCEDILDELGMFSLYELEYEEEK